MMGSRSPGAAFAAVLLLCAGPAASGEGAFEINATCAGVGCFPGDAAGLPILIAQSGSYRLTSNLSTGDPNQTLIQVNADDVSIDLGGFRLSGPAVCSPLPCTNTGGGVGIDVFRNHVNIRNGTVAGLGSAGVQQRGFQTGMLVEDVQAIGNGLDGIALDRGAQVSHCITLRNGRYGIIILDGSASENLSIGNGASGIAYFGQPSGTPPGSGVFSGNVSLSNLGLGFFLFHPALVVENVAVGNGSTGFYGGGAARNVASGNTGAPISGAVSTGPNACNGVAC